MLHKLGQGAGRQHSKVSLAFEGMPQDSTLQQSYADTQQQRHESQCYRSSVTFQGGHNWEQSIQQHQACTAISTGVCSECSEATGGEPRAVEDLGCSWSQCSLDRLGSLHLHGFQVFRRPTPMCVLAILCCSPGHIQSPFSLGGR